MKPDEALAEVRRDLSAAFGESLADKILASVLSAARMAPDGCTADDFAQLIGLLGKDDRVVGMLGEFGVRDRMRRWEKLV